MASWKKVIVSGSDAAFNSVAVGSNQAITTLQSSTRLTGSFSGSFTGDGSGLTGVPAAFPGTAVTDGLISSDKVYVNDGSNKYITFGNLIGDLAGTNLTTETDANGVDSLTLSANLTNLTSVAAATFTGNLTGNVTGNVTGNLAGTASWADFVVNGSGGVLKVSGSTNVTEITLDDETLTIAGTTNQISTNATANTITISLPQNVTIPNNLVVSNNLTVNGTTTSVNTINLAVADKFILLNSGSGAVADSGIVVESSRANATGSGFALYLESAGTPRWAVSSSVSYFTSGVTPDEYMVTTKIINTPHTAGASAPTYGGSGAGAGNMVVDNNGDIWIYS